MRKIKFGSEREVPVLGMGTWMIAEGRSDRRDEIAVLREGLERGLEVIDTAEMYGDGRSEELIGEAIEGQRDKAFLVSKVYPYNATFDGVLAACERTLRRLKTEYLDMYLLHWPGSVPLQETIDAFKWLQERGFIRDWGVSNFDPMDMEEVWACDGGQDCATNQILYNLTRRGPEFDLLPLMEENNTPVMAYSPIEQGRLLRDHSFNAVAKEAGMTPAQLGLTWVLRRANMLAIPKASHVLRLRENRAALDIQLGDDVLAQLDALYPAPTRPVSLEML
ncbi:aldo/keto reductase [Pseudovibrio sp. SPO723]|uniref:aldo/keto reductase n=1 Tax=Nesiotobacter zosterae TaxID=392721 RepID=UPI0029C42256|nr:aldo/keto reductase [Pseudovibrio sp. SPO723]MDX5593352.1 aldo/keto reductase [Pseudovibrio sp. SPO723]